MVTAMKNAVMVKNMPKFLNTWAATKNLDFMSSLKEKHTKAKKIARESKWKVAESCVWT